MTINEACRILGVTSQCTRDEVKKAYSTKAVQFHPEEHPKEYEKIHSAYRLLIREIGNNKTEIVPDSSEQIIDNLETEDNKIQSEEINVKYDFNIGNVSRIKSDDERIQDKIAESYIKTKSKYRLNDDDFEGGEVSNKENSKIWGENEFADSISVSSKSLKFEEIKKAEQVQNERIKYLVIELTTILADKSIEGWKKLIRFFEVNSSIVNMERFTTQLQAKLINERYPYLKIKELFKLYRQFISRKNMSNKTMELYKFLDEIIRKKEESIEKMLVAFLFVFNIVFWIFFIKERFLGDMLIPIFGIIYSGFFIVIYYAIRYDKNKKTRTDILEIDGYYDSRKNCLITVLIIYTIGLIAFYIGGLRIPELIFMDGELFHLILICVNLVVIAILIGIHKLFFKLIKRNI